MPRSPTNIEKENLEAHVELCAERYKQLEVKLNFVETKMEKIELHILAIREALDDKVNSVKTGVNKQALSISGVLIGGLATTVVTLLLTLINK